MQWRAESAVGGAAAYSSETRHACQSKPASDFSWMVIDKDASSKVFVPWDDDAQ
jgi:hypothetical protein